MKNKKALTLVEVIIGITLSMILMTSLMIFTSSGLSNLFLQEKNIGNIFSINQFSEEIKNTLDNFDGDFKILSPSGIIFKRKTEYDKGGFAYIGTTKKDFCENGNPTNHIYIKNFIPKKSKNASFEIKENQVFENDNLIIGKNYFGKDFKENEDKSQVLLNSPSFVTKDLVGNIFISDALNDRILIIEKKSGKVFKFLGEEILKEPNFLKFDGENIEISNSGKGEIIKFSYNEKSDLKKNLSLEIKNKNFDKIRLNLVKSFGKKYNILNYDENEKIKDNFEILDENFGNDFNIENKKEYFQVSLKTNKKNHIFYILKDDFEKLDFQKLIDEEKYFSKNGDEKFENIEFLGKKMFSFDLTPKDNSNFYDIGRTEEAEIVNEDETFIIDGKKIIRSGDNFYIKEIENLIEIDEEGLEIDIQKEKFFHLPDFKININYNFDFKNKIDFGNLRGKIFANFEIIKNDKIIFSSSNNKIFENDTPSFEIEKNLKYYYGETEFFDINNPGNFINFDENLDDYLELPIKDLEINQENDFINIILKYYKNFDCNNPDLNEEKISTIFFKKKIN